jgi:hypothetical protein
LAAPFGNAPPLKRGTPPFWHVLKSITHITQSISIKSILSLLIATLPFEALSAQNMSPHVSLIFAFADFFDFILTFLGFLEQK